MDDMTVRRWRRYGKDRLYVNLVDGPRVGWLDLQTGEMTLEREDLREPFQRALAAHRSPATDSEHPPGSSPATEAEPSPADDLDEVPAVPAESALGVDSSEPYAVRIDWRDLATQQAGQAAQERAVAERKAAPVRTFAARVLGAHTDERAWRIGANGERMVAARLERLPETWKVLHALPVGERGADIDHFVVGPAGVFTINAKHHPDARVWVGGNIFMVNGRRVPYVRNSRHEAKRAARLLSAAVGSPVAATGVIAVVGAAKGYTVKEQPDDVHVVGRKRLVKWLSRLPVLLDDEQIDAIFRAARRSDTWH